MKRYVNLENLPKSSTGKSVLWKKSIGFEVEFVYDDVNGSIKILDYNSKTRHLKIDYLNNEYYIQTSSLINCVLGIIVGKISRDYIYEIGKEFKDEKRDLIIIDRELRDNISKTNKRWYLMKCNRCKHEYWCCEKNVKAKSGCPCCANKTAVLGVNTIWDTDRWMCDLGVSEEDAKKYTKGSDKKIEVKCPYCKHIFVKRISDIYTSKTIACICGDGKKFPEKFVYNILTQLGIDFKTEYSPDYLKRKENDKWSQKRSDFYVPSLNLIIEADGGMNHKGGKIHQNASRTLEEYIEIDEWKDEQHRLHGVETVRIDCCKSDPNYIKNNILSSDLKNYFDLDKINWQESYEFAWKNNLKYEVCQYWNNKREDEFSSDLAKIFKVSSSTINNYLNYGNKISWCNYDAKYELIRRNMYRKKANARRVEVFKGEVSCGIFNSISELCGESLNIFGIEFNPREVSAVCSGKRNRITHKGYMFKYKDL